MAFFSASSLRRPSTASCIALDECRRRSGWWAGFRNRVRFGACDRCGSGIGAHREHRNPRRPVVASEASSSREPKNTNSASCSRRNCSVTWTSRLGNSSGFNSMRLFVAARFHQIRAIERATDGDFALVAAADGADFAMDAGAMAARFARVADGAFHEGRAR